jgi:hypothetical protein
MHAHLFDALLSPGPALALKQVYAWSDVTLSINALISPSSCSYLLSSACSAQYQMGIRAPTFLSEPKSISIPTSVSSLFPICLTTGSSPSLMPASESAIVDVEKPVSITLCSSPPCSTNVAAVVTASAGSIPNNAQVYALRIITRERFIFKACDSCSRF